MLKILNKIIKVGDRIYVTLAILLMFCLVITVTAGIVARYVFRSPFAWTEELAIMFFVWISFLAAAVAAARKRFLVVDYFVAKINPSVQTLIGVVANFLAMVFVVMVGIGAILLFPRMLHRNIAINVPRYIFYIPALISSILIFLVQLESLIQRIVTLIGKNKERESP